MNVRRVSGVACALAVGALLGFVLGAGRSSADRPASRAEDGYRAKDRIADAGEAASLKALRARIRELERQLATRAEGESDAVGEKPAGEDSGRGERPRFGDFRERMERMAKEDPVRFANMTNRMAQWRNRTSERRAAKYEYLASIDTSRLGPQAQQIHASLQEALARREELDQQMFDPNLTDERRHELFGQMRQLDQEMAQLNRKERDNLVRETAKSLGIKGQDLKDFTTTIREVYEATDNGFGGPGGPPPPRGGGPGPR